MKISFLLLILLFTVNASLFSQENAPLKPKADSLSSDAFDEENTEVDFGEIKNPPENVTIKCESFFETLMDESADKAYDKLLRGSPLIMNEKKVKNQVVQTLKAIDLYGAVKGYERSNFEFISPSYMKVTYLSLHSLNPLRWKFTFYKSPTVGWIVLNIKYTDLF